MADNQTKTETTVAPTKKEASKTSDAMLNLFAAAVVDENGLGKFAASMKDVDVHEILRDALAERQVEGCQGIKDC